MLLLTEEENVAEVVTGFIERMEVQRGGEMSSAGCGLVWGRQEGPVRNLKDEEVLSRRRAGTLGKYNRIRKGPEKEEMDSSH